MNTLLAVNGTLIRGLDLNGNLLAVGASFVREARAAPHYRLWSIDDRHLAMVRLANGGAAIALELLILQLQAVALQLRAENAVLLHEILDHVLLVAIYPSREHHEQKL